MIIFVLRHADKKTAPGADDLTSAGRARAQLLARMIGESGLSAAFCSNAKRTQLTLKPLKDLLGAGLKITEVTIDGADQPDKHVDTIVAAINGLGSDVIAAIVSHSNTVPLIIAGLGGGDVGPIEDDEFDKLFVLFDGPGGKTVLKLRYGAAT